MRGKVVHAFGNLVHVEFVGSVQQGEICFLEVGGTALKGEVIEIAGSIVKVQIFEDTRQVKLGSKVEFANLLLEAELGPGLLGSIFDGLQNPLEEIAHQAGFLLQRGLYPNPLPRDKAWEFQPTAKVGDVLRPGAETGWVREGRFRHPIVLPFALTTAHTLTWVASPGSYAIEQGIARGVANGEERVITMLQRWPVKKALAFGERLSPSRLMETGIRIIDTQFPILRGGTFCTPGPFGAGKTVLQHHLAKHASVDVVVVVACGERAGEVVEVLHEFPKLIDPQSGASLMERTVLICNTSSMPVAAREASIYMGVTLAEYYRQMGLDVLCIADSTSRWAQAMREISGRLEEIPGEEAFPVYLASRIASFYERAGVYAVGSDRTGSLTIGGTVSPAGGNFEEPVTQATLVVVGGFIALSRERSDARRYPAIDPLLSWTRYLEGASHELADRMPTWDQAVKRAMKLLRQGDEIARRMEVVGEDGVSLQDLVTYLKMELYEFCFLQQNAFDKEDAYCSVERQVASFRMIDRIVRGFIPFVSKEEARTFFLLLQSELKNLNYIPFGSEAFHASWKRLESNLEQHHI